MKLGFSYKFLFYLLLIVIIVYISLKYFNVIEGFNKKRNSPVRDTAKDQAPMYAENAKAQAKKFLNAQAMGMKSKKNTIYWLSAI